MSIVSTNHVWNMRNLAYFVGRLSALFAFTLINAQSIANPIQEAAQRTEGRIAYVTQSHQDGRLEYQIIVLEPRGKGRYVVARSSEPLMKPQWSPDGNRLAFVGFERGKSAIYALTVATGQLVQLVSNHGINGAPAWSPDGKKIAFAGSPNHNVDIYVLDIASGSTMRLTDDPGIDTDPTWSPDSLTLAFVSNRMGQPQIFTVPTAGGAATQLTSGIRSESPRYFPDGKMLLYVQTTQTGSQIFAMNLAEKVSLQVTAGPRDEDPDISPAGDFIVYTSQSTGSLESPLTLCTIPCEKPVLLSTENASYPTWSRVR